MTVLDSTNGIFLVTVFLETMLYGCGLLQTWLYFHWYPKDHWGIKMMVILLVIFETLQITLVFASTYGRLITNFGDVSVVWVITRFDAGQLLSGYLSAFTVQLYFAYTVYILSNKQKFVPILIVVLALASIGAGVAQVYITLTRLRSFLHFQDTQASYVTQSAATLACDIAITVSLLVNLGGHKDEYVPDATNSMLNKLMVITINRGVLTALCAAVNMILFFSLPETFWFFLGILLSGKLYMNSALATLNSRRYIRGSTRSGIVDSDNWHSTPLAGLPGTPVKYHREDESQIRFQSFCPTDEH